MAWTTGTKTQGNRYPACKSNYVWRGRAPSACPCISQVVRVNQSMHSQKQGRIEVFFVVLGETLPSVPPGRETTE